MYNYDKSDNTTTYMYYVNTPMPMTTKDIARVRKDRKNHIIFHLLQLLFSSCVSPELHLVLWDHGLYVVYIWKWGSAHALGGVSGVGILHYHW